MVKLIGLYSERPQSGKSTVAEMLQQELGYECIPFAGTLKRMARVLLEDLGMSAHEVNIAMSSGKEEPLHLLAGRTPRQLMQSLGTEWGRGCMDDELWNRCWFAQAAAALTMGCSVVVDDVRFPGEAKLIRDHAGMLVQVVRPAGGSDRFIGHSSEGGLQADAMDALLMNDGNLDDLWENLLTLLKPARELSHAAG